MVAIAGTSVVRVIANESAKRRANATSAAALNDAPAAAKKRLWASDGLRRFEALSLARSSRAVTGPNQGGDFSLSLMVERQRCRLRRNIHHLPIHPPGERAEGAVSLDQG